MANVKNIADRRLVKKIKCFGSRKMPKIIKMQKGEIRGIPDYSGDTKLIPAVVVLVDLDIPVNETRMVIDLSSNTLTVSHGSYPGFSFLDSYWRHLA